MPIWVEWIIAVTTVGANIVTIVGIVFVVIAVIPIRQNRFSKKTFNVIPKIKFHCFKNDGNEYNGDILFQNYTDKCFHIIKLSVVVDDLEYEIHTANAVNQYDEKTLAKNIAVTPYQAFDLKLTALLPKKVENKRKTSTTKAKLKVYTTRKTLLYDAEIVGNCSLV